MPSSAPRQGALDALRLLLAAAVVGIHAQLLHDAPSPLGHLTTEGLLRLAVPLFLLINGYFLQPLLDQPGAMRRWLLRIARLHLIWAALYAPLWLASAASPPDALKAAAAALLVGYYHLWYLPALLGAGVLLWLLRGLSAAALGASALALYALGVAIQYLGPDWGLASTHLHRNALLFALPFVAFGALIRRTPRATQLSPSAVRLALLAGLAAVLLESWLMQAQGQPQGRTIDQLATLAWAAPALFIWALQQPTPRGWLGSHHTARLAAGVFLIHIYPLTLGRLMGLEATALTLFALAASVPLSALVLRSGDRWQLIR